MAECWLRGDSEMKGWRTLGINGGILAAAGVAKLSGYQIPDLDPENIAIIIAFINLILRWLTTTPVMKSE